MANGLERMLANIGASNIREQQREERMSSNILNQAFRQEQERVKDGTDILKNLNSQIQGLSDPSQIDSVRSTAQSIVSQIDNPVTSSIMGLIDNSVNLQKQKINVERKEKAIVQQFDSKLKNVKSQSDLNALKLDIATMETGDLKDDLSKRLQGISTSITEIQTQNASDFLMQDNAGLIFNPERFTDVQKDSVLKQSNIFKRYDTNDELDPQEKKILLQINNALRLKASGNNSQDKIIEKGTNDFIELQYPTVTTPTGGVLIGGNQIASEDEVESDAVTITMNLETLQSNYTNLGYPAQSSVDFMDLDKMTKDYGKNNMALFTQKSEALILKQVNSFMPPSVFSESSNKNKSIFNDEITKSDYETINGSLEGYHPNVSTYGDLRDKWLVENEFGSYFKAPVLKQALNKARNEAKTRNEIKTYVSRNVFTGQKLKTGTGDKAEDLMLDDNTIFKTLDHIETSLKSLEKLQPIIKKYNFSGEETSEMSDDIKGNANQSLF